MTTPRVNVDELIKQTSPHQVAGHLGIALPPKTSGELRIDCLFCEQRSSTYGNLVVNLDKPHNPIYAHCCGVRGNLLMLMYGMVHGRPPSGGKLQGEDFNEMKQLLIEVSQPGSTAIVMRSNEEDIPKVEEEPPNINVPMKHAEKEAARDLANLYEDFITDPQAMKPAAGQYVRQRPWLTPEIMERWRIGWIPGDGRSMFRRDFLVYTQLDEQGEVLSYSGRDLHFDEKQKRWEEADRPADKKPAKHRFVKGYHRGLELYGQHRERLTPALRESLRRYGLVVVEGPNDVIRLDCLGIAAVGLCSNKGTDEQVTKIVRFAKRLAGGRVWLMQDNDPEGEDGFKELLWKLAQHEEVDARLAWTSEMHCGQFAGRESESLSDEEARNTLLPFLLRRE